MMRRKSQPTPTPESLQAQLGKAADTPSHPKLAAALLMAGIVLFIILISLAPLI